ncbi:hypothetical protein [Streptomyces albidoflavus]|uniref:hypothetical protein n=1 Tax=Streptomyces albidoflavus TaxID=1886 RepID=UPI001021191D|nr:hypothetical protein [Streptomyces albidoflavus]RZF02857.1 hypothetical protein C0R05_32095 [Streptomyces albidoflavus]
MKNFKIRWTEKGERVTSVVSYDEPSALKEVARKQTSGLLDVEMIEVPAFGGARVGGGRR